MISLGYEVVCVGLWCFVVWFVVWFVVFCGVLWCLVPPFATGVTVSSETEHSLLNALDTGNTHVSKFIKERFFIPEGNSASS